MLSHCHVIRKLLALDLQGYLEAVNFYQSTSLTESTLDALSKQHTNLLKYRRRYFVPCMKVGRAGNKDVQTLLLSQLPVNRISVLEIAFNTYRNITIQKNDKDI